MIYQIVAMDENRVIGKDNRLPWHFPEDLKHFKTVTMGQTVIMGRKTYESIGRPLPGRTNYVLSRSLKSKDVDPVRFFDSMDEALKHVETRDVFIIGGAQVFKETINRVDGIYLTQIHAKYEGDAFYPEIPALFKEASRSVLKESPRIEARLYKRFGT